MNVLNGLPGVRPGVEDHPVPILGHPLADRYLVGMSDDIGQQPVTGGGKLCQIGVMRARDNEHVYRRLRIDIPEGDGASVVGHYGCRQLAGGNGAEQAVRHAADLNVSPTWDGADIYGCSTANPAVL